MGLDSYFRKTVRAGETAPIPELPDDLVIVGGMMTGHYFDGDFRGKVYHDIVTRATNNEFGLYETRINSYDVGCIAKALKADAEQSDEYLLDKYQGTWIFDHEDALKLFRDFVKFFHAFAEKGYKLYGWW